MNPNHGERRIAKRSKVRGGASALAARINREHRLSRGAMIDSLRHAVRAGLLLLKAKALVPYGAWARYISQRCEVPDRTARLYMQVARAYPHLAQNGNVADLTLRQAVALLAQPKREVGSPPPEPQPVRFAVPVEAPAPAARAWARVTEPEPEAPDVPGPGWRILAAAAELERQVESLVELRKLLDEAEMRELVGAVLAVADLVQEVRRTGPYEFSDQDARRAWDPHDDEPIDEDSNLEDEP